MSDPLDDLSTAIADRYRLDRELGRGGMATVRLALDLKHNRPVAIKVLLPELAASLGAERFQQEIKLTAQLNHPHILPLLDSGNVNGLLYYVMPFVEGKSLRERLDRERQLPVEEGVRIVLQVTDAVEYAHRHGVIHRDIKPENVLLDEGHAVVADFGIARAVNVASEGRLTGSGIAIGTPAYMSPEQATGSGALDARSDVYALGCLLYEILAGQPPFTGASTESVIRQHLLAEPRLISDVRAGVPAPVVAALGRALAKTPSDRFPSARAFGEALGSASPSGVGATPSKTRRPSRSRLLLGALLLVVASALGVWALRRPAPVTEPKVAVLPLRNLSADSSDSYFVQAMHEDLGSRIGVIPRLSVTSRNSVLRFHPGQTPTPTIARELGVDFLLEGSVRLDSQRVDVAVQLVDARNDTQVWSQSYARDRSVASLIDIQADIASRLADALRVRLSAAVRGRLGDHPTESTAAYELFLRASQLPRFSDPEANNAAEELLKQAIALDPQFLEASAALAHVYVSRTYLLGRPRAWADSGLVLARRALSADSTLDTALDALGMVYLDLGRLAQARAAYSKLLELRPSSGRAMLVLGWINFLQGKLTEAVGYWNHARVVDPMNATVAGDMHLVEMLFGDVERASRWKELEAKLEAPNGIGDVQRTRLLLWQGKTVEALQSAERQLRAAPRSYPALGMAARAAIEAGKLERARQYLGEMERSSPDDWDFWGTTYRTSYAHVLSRLGDRERANELLERTLREGMRLIDEGDERPGVRREIAAIHAALGHQDDAYLWLERAIEAGWRHEALEPSPLFRTLHGDSRFKSSMARIDADIAVAKQRVRVGNDNEAR